MVSIIATASTATTAQASQTSVSGGDDSKHRTPAPYHADPTRATRLDEAAHHRDNKALNEHLAAARERFIKTSGVAARPGKGETTVRVRAWRVACTVLGV